MTSAAVADGPASDCARSPDRRSRLKLMTDTVTATSSATSVRFSVKASMVGSECAAERSSATPTPTLPRQGGGKNQNALLRCGGRRGRKLPPPLRGRVRRGALQQHAQRLFECVR